MEFSSPAKINVHLEVGPLRQDGYHEICSWFLMVNLYDRIHIDIEHDMSGIDILGNLDVPVEHDLMAVAAGLFYEQTGFTARCEIRIKKCIPLGAGLGGGSSNAATVLRGLNVLHSYPFEEQQLRQLALQLGSDVPFFLSYPSAIVTGRGEILEEMYVDTSWWAVLVHPGFSIHTKDAYTWLDEDRKRRSGAEKTAGSPAEKCNSSAGQIRSIIANKREKWRFYNDFSSVLFPRYPVLKHICGILGEEGAIHTGVSGSGSTCFGLFKTYEEASKASLKLPDMRSWIKETLASSGNDVLK